MTDKRWFVQRETQATAGRTPSVCNWILLRLEDMYGRYLDWLVNGKTLLLHIDEQLASRPVLLNFSDRDLTRGQARCG